MIFLFSDGSKEASTCAEHGSIAHMSTSGALYGRTLTDANHSTEDLFQPVGRIAIIAD
ncbi:MAG: hypothetical protein ABI970_10925 [Chloroflexota bacterium]